MPSGFPLDKELNPARLNRRVMPCLLVLLWAVLPTLSSLPAAASPDQLAEAISLYNSRQYSRALSRLQACLNASGTDLCSAHYYMGLCYQNLNQVAGAQSEYSWVISHEGNAVLRYYAGQALAQLQKYKGRRSYAGNGNVSHSSSGGSTYLASAGGRPRVLDFTASWCPHCRELAPTVEQVQGQYGSKVDFVQLDADSDQGKQMMGQYGVNVVPTLIFLDGSGKVCDRTVGAISAEQLTGILHKLTGR